MMAVLDERSVSSSSSSRGRSSRLLSRCSQEERHSTTSSHVLHQQQLCLHDDDVCSPSHSAHNTRPRPRHHHHHHHGQHCHCMERPCRKTPKRRFSQQVFPSPNTLFVVVFLSSLLICSSTTTTLAWMPPTTTSRSRIPARSRRRLLTSSSFSSFSVKKAIVATTRIKIGPSLAFLSSHYDGPSFSSSTSHLVMSSSAADADAAAHEFLEENDNEETTTGNPPTTTTTTPTTLMTATDRFHEDMRRVLDSRRQQFLHQHQQLDSHDDHDGYSRTTTSRLLLQQPQQLPVSNNNINNLNIQRHNRPIILDSDVDGAERVLTLLQVLCQRNMATETSFQLVMQAFVNRGRLRWKNSTTTNTITTGSDASTSSSSSASSFHTTTPNKNKDQIICAADQVEVLFHQLQQHQGKVPLSMKTYNLVLQAYANCATPRGDRDYAQRAMNVLHEMELVYNGNTTNIPVESLCHVLHAAAWQQPNLQLDGYWAKIASRLLNRIVHQIHQEEKENKSIKTNNDETTTIISRMSETNARHFMQCHAWTLEAWSKSGSIGSAQAADAILDKMKHFNSTLTTTTTTTSGASQFLDAEAYSNAILAWSKASFDENENDDISKSSNSSSRFAAERAHDLLMEMLDTYAAGSFPMGSEPLLIAFNGVISAWGRCGLPNKAADILTLLEEIRPTCRNLIPDAVSYNSVLHAFLRCPRNKVESANRVLDFVRYMEEHCKDQPAIQPNAFTYNTLMRCLIQSIAKRTVGTSISINNNNNNNDSIMVVVQEMEEALLKMERCWAQGDWSIEPSNRAFNMVINAYAKSSDRFAARKALDLFHGMIEASSSSVSSSSIPYLDSQEQHPSRRYQNRLAYSFQPDIITVTSVIECLSKSTADPTAPLQAQELLAYASNKYKETQDISWMPNLRAFTMAIMTHANNHNGSVVQARQLLSELVELYNETKNPKLLPNEYPYNYVLNCAANTIDKNMKLEAFQIATKTYQEMRQSSTVRPDSYTYAFWIKCCNNLLKREEVRNGARIINEGNNGDDLRSKCIKFAFEDCKKHGLLSSEVLNRLLQGSPRWLVDELLEWDGSSSKGNGNSSTSSSSSVLREQPNNAYRKIYVRDLPPSWSRNIARR